MTNKINRYFIFLPLLLIFFQPLKTYAGTTGIVAATALVSSTVGWAIYGDDHPIETDTDRFLFGVGFLDPADDEYQGEIRLEYHSDYFLWKLAPIAGLSYSKGRAVMGYTGIRLETYIFNNISIIPSFSVALRHKNDGDDTGSNFLFRSALDLGYQFDNGIRASTYYYHISHADLGGDYNPGEDQIGLSVSIPIDLIDEASN